MEKIYEKIEEISELIDSGKGREALAPLKELKEMCREFKANLPEQTLNVLALNAMAITDGARIDRMTSAIDEMNKYQWRTENQLPVDEEIRLFENLINSAKQHVK